LLTAGEPGRDLSALLALYEKTLEETAVADLATLLRLATAAALEDGIGLQASLSSWWIRRSIPRSRETCSRADFAFASRPGGDAIRGRGDAGADAGRARRRRESWQRRRRSRPRADLAILSASAAVELSGDTLDYFSAPGEGMECVEIARRIRFLAGAGIPFDRVAVLLRDPERYQPFLEEALRRAGIPAHFSRGVVRPDPAGRAFLALLACARERLFGDPVQRVSFARPGTVAGSGRRSGRPVPAR